MSSSILNRATPAYGAASSPYTPLQVQVDGLVGGFVHQATDGPSLMAMVAGGMAYRCGRVATLGRGIGAVNQAVARQISVLASLTVEVTAFEVTHRGLSPHTGNPNLWRWNGNGGLRQGLFQSFITFGALKGAGRLVQGENLIAQHLFQDSAMVLGHHAIGALGIAPRPTGTLAEQFLHAEATNLQMGAGLALGHRLAPGLLALQRGLEISLPPPARERKDDLPFPEGLALATAHGETGGRTVPHPLRPGSFDILLSENTGEGSLPSVPGRREYWFPHKALRGGPLHVKYTSASRALADRLMEELSRTEGTGESPSELHVSLLWVYQWIDLALKLSADVDIFGPERLTDPLVRGKEGGNPQILAQALELLRKDSIGPEAEWVVEMRIPYEKVSFGREGTNFHTNLRYILQTIESHLYDSVRLVEKVPGSPSLKIRLPPPALLQRILHVVAGEETTLFRYVRGEIPQHSLVQMKARGEAPIGLSRDPVKLGDLGIKVHPALFTLHDLFHAISLSVFSQSFRRYAGWLYDLVSNSRLRRSPLTREHLDRLSDMDPPIVERRTYDTFFSYIFAHLAKHYKIDFGSDQIRCQSLLKYRFFLQDYIQLLDNNPPDSPEWRHWNEQIKLQLKPVLKGLDGILQKLNALYFDLPKQK